MSFAFAWMRRFAARERAHISRKRRSWPPAVLILLSRSDAEDGQGKAQNNALTTVSEGRKTLAPGIGFGGSFPRIWCDRHAVYLGNQANSSTTYAELFTSVCRPNFAGTGSLLTA